MPIQTLEKILYAEDEPDIQAVTQIALEDIGGFTVKYCSTGHEVLTAANNFLADLLLLDVMMPGLDGPTTLQELRKLPDYKNIPAIFMTAKVQPNEIAAYKAMGVIEVINKPFDPMKLVEAIKAAWMKHHGL